MDPKVLYLLARFRPLTSWSGAGILLAAAVTIREMGIDSLNWTLFAAAAAIVVLLQYVAHPLNDIVDYPVDKQANIGGTGRHKPLLSGLATIKDFKAISAVVLALALTLTAYVASALPFALVFGAVGFFTLFAYNLKPFALSYKPFSEVLVGGVSNLVMILGVSYVLAGQVLLAAGIVGAIHALMSTSMHCSYFAMDYQSDAWGSKKSTIVTWPYGPWEALYPAIGLGATAAIGLFSVTSLGFTPLVAAVAFALLLFLGTRIAITRQQYHLTHGQYYMCPVEDPSKVVPATLTAWGAASGSMRKALVAQMNVIILSAIVFAVALVVV